MGNRSWSTSSGVTGFEYSAATATGPVRQVNEDSLLAEPPVFLVADGMGGHSRGDVASSRAIAVFRDRIVAEQAWTPDDVLEAVRQAHNSVGTLGGGARVSGTTLAGVVLVEVRGAQIVTDETPPGAASPGSDPEAQYRWMVVNVGDSRVYQWTGERLNQLTIDHTVVQELVTRGDITAQAAREHPDRNVITRALGVSDESVADVQLLSADGVSTFLICSDGVSGVLDSEEIASAMSGDIESAAEAVVARALARGSRDNVTAVVLRSTVRSGAANTSTVTEDTAPRSELLA